MNKFYACLFFLFLGTGAYAQQIEITETFPTICLNAAYELPVNITGQFSANNIFNIELQPDYNNGTITLPAIFLDG